MKGNKLDLGDGVDQNDKPFLTSFPYQAAPTSGFDQAVGRRVEPPHVPTPAGNILNLPLLPALPFPPRPPIGPQVP